MAPIPFFRAVVDVVASSPEVDGDAANPFYEQGESMYLARRSVALLCSAVLMLAVFLVNHGPASAKVYSSGVLSIPYSGDLYRVDGNYGAHPN